MNKYCHNHPKYDADNVCHYCGRYMCIECLGYDNKRKYYCCKNTDDCLKCQTGDLPSPDNINFSNQYPINAINIEEADSDAEDLYKQAWRCYKANKREKLIETLLLLVNKFPESTETRKAIDCFYTTKWISPYLSKEDKTKFRALLNKFKVIESQSSAMSVLKTNTSKSLSSTIQLASMKRKGISLLVVVLAITALTMRIRLDYRDPSITPPSGWKVVSGDQLRSSQSYLEGVVPADILEGFSIASQDIVTAYYFDSGNKEPTPMIVLAVQPGRLKLTERTFQEIASEYKQAFLSGMPPVMIIKIEDIQLINIDHTPALAAKIEMSYKDSTALGFQYLVPAGRNTVTITGMCPVESMNLAVCTDIVRQSADSLRLPWQVPSLVLNFLMGIFVGGLVFAWIYWSETNTPTDPDDAG